MLVGVYEGSKNAGCPASESTTISVSDEADLTAMVLTSMSCFDRHWHAFRTYRNAGAGATGSGSRTAGPSRRQLELQPAMGQW